MREIFNMPLNSLPIDIVRYTIRYLTFETGIDTDETLMNLGEDVTEYCESFENALSSVFIRTPEQFCHEFTANRKQIEKITNCLYYKANITEPKDFTDVLIFQLQSPELKKNKCIFYLSNFGVYDGKRDQHLFAALYLRKQIHFCEKIEDLFYHTPDSYEYYYVEDIAERVFIKGTIVSPDRFCAEKYNVVITITEASTPSSSSQVSHEYENQHDQS